MPQVCVELLFGTADGMLLAKRTAHPTIWFWPGSRLHKGERLAEAAHRVAREELSASVNVEGRYGPYARFWDDSVAEGSPSRHTVNVVFDGGPTTGEYEIQLGEQHSAYQFVCKTVTG